MAATLHRLYTCCADEADDALDHGRGDLKFREAEDAPSIQCRFEILLGVSGESLRSIVPASNPKTALDLDERSALDVGEVGAPLALGVKPELTFQLWPTERTPVECEFRFEAGRR